MAYALANSYMGESLLSGFNWFDGADPSNGFVDYKSRSDAADLGLFDHDPLTGVVRLGVDKTNTYGPGQGRPSIRLESKEAYNHGLFIADFLHMPPSQCGLWPAFWSYGPNWPYGGEVDIIEGANNVHRNLISAHTAPGCEVSNTLARYASGSVSTSDCDIGQQNIGCGYTPTSQGASSYGDGFNAAGGGIYAMQWDDEHIRVWHFPRDEIPADIEQKKPDPKSWGKPVAAFGGDSCKVDNYFRDMSIVLNINFCGDYGNAVWESDGCNAFAPTCSDWVGGNPAAFANAYWDVNYIDAYTFQDGKAPTGISKPHSSPNRVNGSEPTTTTTKTTTTSSTITVNPKPAKSVKPPANPKQIKDYAYLGCFGSSSGFEGFSKKADDKSMTLEKCVGMCGGKKYAGIFDTSCYCGSKMDVNTRASGSEMDCNVECPGDSVQYCGGRVNGELPSGLGEQANITKPDASNSNNSTASASSGPSALNSEGTGSNATVAAARRSVPWQGLKFRSLRAVEAPKKFLLTVYASVAEEKPPKPAPAMAGPRKKKATTTIHPNNKGAVVDESTTTLTVPGECDCEETDVPWSTTTVVVPGQCKTDEPEEDFEETTTVYVAPSCETEPPAPVEPTVEPTEHVEPTTHVPPPPPSSPTTPIPTQPAAAGSVQLHASILAMIMAAVLFI